MRRSLALFLSAVVAPLPLALFHTTPAEATQAPVAFTSAALSTWQLGPAASAVGWTVAQSQGRVFVGGDFGSIRPPGAAGGSGELVRDNFAVFDAETGDPTSCAPSFTLPANPAQATVRTLDVSPDGATVYVGGFFTSVAGVAVQNLAAIDIASCTVVSSFKPMPNGYVRAIRSTSSIVYFGGGVTSVQGQTRARAAAVNAVGSPSPGALQAWAPSFDKEVRAIGLKPDGSAIVVGGDFDLVNGADSHALAVVDPSGATIKTYPMGFFTKTSMVKVIVVDATGFYTGNEGTGTAVFDGRIAVDWSTLNQRWRADCLGATQGLALYRGLLYSASHAHDCALMGWFPDGPRNHFLAESVTDAHIQPWFPNSNDGVNEKIGPRAIVVASAASGDYLWSVGEFTTVNGATQQGITRFGQGPDTVGPVAPTLSLSSPRPGQARVTWRMSTDTDDSTLTYRVYRDGGSAPVYTTTGDSYFWTRRQMTFLDNGLADGSSHSYRVTASDGTNTITSLTRSVTIGSGLSTYADRVQADGASLLWRYDEPSTTYLADATPNGYNGTLRSGAAFQVTPAAIAGDPSRALTLTGTSGIIYGEVAQLPPPSFTLETWFKTTTTVGGKIIGFGDKQTIESRDYDRQIYMANDGTLLFGMFNGTATAALRSARAYNDGAWHHVAATQDASGMALYVDAVRVGRNNIVGTRSFRGYWRVGGDVMGPIWTARPTSNYWQGSLDETAVFPTALSGNVIGDHYVLAGGTPGAGATAPADFYGKTVYADDPLVYWRLGEAGGPTAADSAPGGTSPGTYSGGVTYGRPGAVAGTSDSAVQLNGSSAGLVASSAATAGPSKFSVEAWVKTTSTTGGKILGFGDKPSSDSTSTAADRHLYMRDDGKIVFGMRSGTSNIVVTSTSAYNNGAYHHVVGTRSASGMVLWVDGVQVASNTVTGGPVGYNGYWRVGGDTLAGWSGAPTSKYFSGTVDEAAVYPLQLTREQVAAHYSAGNGAAPDMAAPTAPGSLQVGGTGSAVNLTWSASSDNVGVVRYDVYRSATAGFTPDATTLIGSTTSLAYTDTAQTGQTYYRIVAVDGAGNRSRPSNQATTYRADTTAPTAPTSLAVSTTTSSATLSWPASTDDVAVVEYTVYRSTTAGFSPSGATAVATTPDTGYADSPLATGRYYYRVTARDAAGNVSGPSPEAVAVVADTSPPSTPTGLAASVSGANVTLTWNDSTDNVAVTGYEVHRSAVSGFTPSNATLIGTSTGATYTDSNRPIGAWYYRVLALDAAGNTSGASTQATAFVHDTAAPTPPGAIRTSVSGSAVTVDWDPSSDDVAVSGYDVHRSASSGFTPTAATRVASVSGTTYSDNGRPAGTWYYRVVAKDAEGNVSDPSAQAAADVADTTAPSIPTNLAAVVTGSTVALSWDASSDDTVVTAYDVYRSSTSGFVPDSSTLVASVSGLSFNDSARPVGSWFYRVAARDGAGNRSGASNEARADVSAPSVVTVVPVADTYGNAGAPTSNFGASWSLMSRGTSGGSSFLRYVLPAAPVGKSLTGAVLRISTTTESTAGSIDSHDVSVASDAWNESTLTWNNRPAVTGPRLGTISGATAVNSSYDTALSVSSLSGLLGSQTTLTVASTGRDSLYFWSRENTTPAGRPQLILTFS